MKKILLIILITLISIIGIGSISLLVTGNSYVFVILKHTVFKGRLGPTIYEYKIFKNREVKTGTPKPWNIHKRFNTESFTDEELAYHKAFKSVSFAVMNQDTLLFEQHWNGVTDTSHLNSWSMAKGIISHLIGCALKDGLIESVDDPIGKYLPEYPKSKTRIRDLLTMSSGFNFDESYINPFSYSARGLYEKDIYKVHERYEEVKAPGVQFDYQSANSQLLSFIITRVTGKSVSEYASQKLWQPIGAEHAAYWSLDHEGGVEKAFCCFNTNVRDFGKFGLLYLNKGIVDGDTLITPEYFKEATRPATYLDDMGATNNRYGFQWWTLDYLDENIFYARGIQGQYIFILPKRELVIVRLGESRPSIRINGHPEDVFKYIDMGVRLYETTAGK